MESYWRIGTFDASFESEKFTSLDDVKEFLNKKTFTAKLNYMGGGSQNLAVYFVNHKPQKYVDFSFDGNHEKFIFHEVHCTCAWRNTQIELWPRPGRKYDKRCTYPNCSVCHREFEKYV